ncbi:MAG: PIN domain-containing protein [Synergistaceae bacterium]|nr:PIN domain-containing protein [Synergistaceae bacterium]
MTGIERLFLDTAPLIYFLDDDENYAEKMRHIFYDALVGGVKLITSAITVTEYLTYPCRTGNIEKINAFFEFINDAGIEAMPIDTETAVKAAQIRADYPHFKTMDALQLASACVNYCDIFLTNDKQLCRFSEIKCVHL